MKSKAKKPEKKLEKKPAKKVAPKKAPTKKVAAKKAVLAPKKAKKPEKVANPPKKVKVEPKSKLKAPPVKPLKAAPAAKVVEPKLAKKPEPKTKPLTQDSTPKKAKKLETAAEKAPKAVKKVEEEVFEDSADAKREYNDEEIILTDAEGRRYCRVKDCDQLAAVDAYCRYHYLLFWKKIQVRKKILTEGKLERYVEDLTARYPDKYLEMLKKDLRNEKEFLNAIQELELDDTSGENDLEDEAQSYIEEVRGISTESGASSRDDDEF